MRDPTVLVEEMVEQLRLISALMAEMNNDVERVYGYYDDYPASVNLQRAIYELPWPGVLVAWDSTSPGSFASTEIWSHQISCYIHGQDVNETYAGSYRRIIDAIINGTPYGSSIRLRYMQLDDSFNPPGTASISRGTDLGGFDYMVITFPYRELGDD